MQTKQFIHTIILTRLVQTAVSTLGEKTYSASSYGYASSIPGQLLNEIPARVEEYNMIIEYRKSSERIKNATLIYIPASYLPQERDRVFWGSTVRAGVTRGEYIGIITGINPGFKGNTNILDHWECTVENP